MVVAQVGAFAAGVEAARVAGVQQSAQAQATSASQRQNSDAADEAGLRKTEVVEETNRSDASNGASDRRLDITV